MFSIFFPENLVIYGIIWKGTVEPDRPQMTARHTCILCPIPKATDTHAEYVILPAFPRQQWLHERASMLRDTYLDLF